MCSFRRLVGWFLPVVTLVVILWNFALLRHDPDLVGAEKQILSTSAKVAYVFSIGAWNNALLFASFVSSFLEHNPVETSIGGEQVVEFRFVYVVADRDENGIHLQLLKTHARLADNIEFVYSDDIGFVRGDSGNASFSSRELAMRYDLQSFSCALKPLSFLYLFNRNDCFAAYYFDPDILIGDSVDLLLKPFLRNEKNPLALVTPHRLTPYPDDEKRINEHALYWSGQFNFGFVAWRKDAKSIKVISYWAEWLRYHAWSDVKNGDFTDQRFGDTLASFLEPEELHVIRDPRVNVAYWNLHERGSGIHMSTDDRIMFNETHHVVFFHFSGVLGADRQVVLSLISRHQDRLSFADLPRLRPLHDKFAASIRDACDQGCTESVYNSLLGIPYGFDRFDDKLTRVPTFFKNLFVELSNPRSRSLSSYWFRSENVDQTNPFAIMHPFSAKKCSDFKYRRTFLCFLFGSAAGATFFSDHEPHNILLVHELYLRRVDAMERYPAFDNPVIDWFLSSGAEEAELLDGPWVDQVRETYSTRLSHFVGPWEKCSRDGFNVFGYFGGVFSIAALAELVVSGLHAANVSVSKHILAVQEGSLAQVPEISRFATHCASIFVANADNAPLVSQIYSLPGIHRIGVWAWELDEFPDVWMNLLRRYDEVWGISNFVANSIRSNHLYDEEPVYGVPLGVPIVDSAALGDVVWPVTELGPVLGEGAFVAVTIFDFNSFLFRKNPIGAIETFVTAALGETGKVGYRPVGESDRRMSHAVLILKTLAETNSQIVSDVFEFDRAVSSARQKLRGLNASHLWKTAEIRLVNGAVSSSAIKALHKRADVYISLSRSEGFGLGPLAALFRGKPVIVTEYGGSAEYLQPVREKLGDTIVPHSIITSNISYGPYVAGSRWCEPDISAASLTLQRMYNDYDVYVSRAVAAGAVLRPIFDSKSFGVRMKRKLERIISAKFTRKKRKSTHKPPRVRSRQGDDRIIIRKDLQQ